MARTEPPRPLALDTSVIVALVSGWHAQHEVTRAALERMLGRGHPLFAPAPALVEAYSVLTRLPPPHRIAPKVALGLLRSNFGRGATPALSGKAVWKILGGAVERVVSGGRVHDWIIACSASQQGPCILVTFNVRHFTAFQTDDLHVRTPEALEPGG